MQLTSSAVGKRIGTISAMLNDVKTISILLKCLSVGKTENNQSVDKTKEGWFGLLQAVNIKVAISTIHFEGQTL